ncbi:MAG: glycosyltransferase [Anaerolineae bacterium]|nr:glycosyltransferase [Anaerolineae bacterium]
MSKQAEPATRPVETTDPRTTHGQSAGVQIRCSVIVPVFNGARVIDRCLDALARQTIPPAQFEIIIVDDGSTDRTAERVAEWAGQHPGIAVSVLRQSQAGPASARNRGALAARGPILLFTDADCRPVPGWIAALLDGFDTPDPPAGLMGIYCTDQTDLAGRFAQMEFEDRYSRMRQSQQLDVVATYSAAFQRDLFLAEGGFDPGFPKANNEDVEFSYRLSEQGYRMRFVPEAQVYHHHANTWLRYTQLKSGRGYWRTIVYRRYPGKALRDTYTPQVLKLQILLAPLAVVGVVAALLHRRIGWTALAAPFLATTLPFVRFAARRDPAVAAVSPWGLWLRSIAFAAGVAAGALASLRGQPEQKSQPTPDEVRP